MKKITLLLTFVSVLNCSSQNLKVKDLSTDKDLNYIIATLNVKNIKIVPLENYSVTVFEQFDSKNTPENYSPETDEIISSLIISVSPDGDYYTNSKLLKVEGITSPVIIEIKDSKDFKRFFLTLEHGIYSNRKTETIELEGVQ